MAENLEEIEELVGDLMTKEEKERINGYRKNHQKGRSVMGDHGRRSNLL